MPPRAATATGKPRRKRQRKGRTAAAASDSSSSSSSSSSSASSSSSSDDASSGEEDGSDQKDAVKVGASSGSSSSSSSSSSASGSRSGASASSSSSDSSSSSESDSSSSSDSDSDSSSASSSSADSAADTAANKADLARRRITFSLSPEPQDGSLQALSLPFDSGSEDDGPAASGHGTRTRWSHKNPFAHIAEPPRPALPASVTDAIARRRTPHLSAASASSEVEQKQKVKQGLLDRIEQRKAEDRERRKEAFKGLWMKSIAEEFGDELEAIRNREPTLGADGGTRLPLFIDALGAGSEIISSSSSLASAKTAAPGTRHTRPMRATGSSQIDEVALAMDLS